MKRVTNWNRRDFLQRMSYLPLAGALNGFALPQQSSSESAPRFAYVASASDDAIHVFEVDGDRPWIPVQRVQTAFPSFLSLHPANGVLYVANELDEHEGLPRGTVEAYAIDPENGTLNLLDRQPLSLSATKPRHLAISPDGHHLVVAVYGGGAYNVFSLKATGELGHVTGIFKQLGSGRHTEYQDAAHPHTVVFDTTGQRFISSDLGCDRLNVFEVESGRLVRRSELVLPEGKGPGCIVLHPSGSFLYRLSELDGSVSCHRYDVAEAKVETHFQEILSRAEVPGSQPNRASLTIHPSGRFVYASGHSGPITAWRIDQTSGRLSEMDAGRQPSDGAEVLAINDVGSVVCLDRKRGALISLTLEGGRFVSNRHSASLRYSAAPETVSLAIKYL